MEIPGASIKVSNGIAGISTDKRYDSTLADQCLENTFLISDAFNNYYVDCEHIVCSFV